MLEIKDMFFEAEQPRVKKKKNKTRKGTRKTKNKFTNIFAGNLRQNKISWTTGQGRARPGQAGQQCRTKDKQEECDCVLFYFSVFSPNFIMGFPWQSARSALIT